MKHKPLVISIAVFAFLLALGIMLYPPLSTAYNEKHQAEILTQYQEVVEEKDNSLLLRTWNLAESYNEALVPVTQREDAFSQSALLEATSDYWEQLNVTGNGIMGYIEIPAVEVYLPIYHGTSEETLQIGIGHLLGSSLPVGGESTHTILTGHSGMANQRMFTDIPQLESGDVLYLHILNQVLAYQVFQKAEVLPYETDKLGIVTGKDLCTLITCTPIGINTHRLLVTAERIPYEVAEVIGEVQIQEEKPVSCWEENYIKGIIIGICVVIVVVVIGAIFRLLTKKHNSSAKSLLIVLMVLLFMAGVVALGYPYLHGAYVDRQMEANAEAFINRTDSETVPAPITPTESLAEAPVQETEPRAYGELWDAMAAYNERLWEEKQSGLCDPWSYKQPSFALCDYGIGDEIFGAIEIPALGLSMPIYLGASDEHLAAGAAQLSQTSLPIGGINTNCVIAGHRGWRGADYFRYIPDLQIGDEIIITNLWETLTYTVTETQIIAPNDVDKILIQEGKDMLTLITCHPYASGGKQRYVVYCERSE